MRFLTTLLLATTFGGISLHAQEKPRKIQTSFYCFRYANNLKDIYVRTGAESFGLIELSTANMIGPVGVVVTGGGISLHRQKVKADGSTVYPRVGWAKLGTVLKPLVILFPGPKEDKLPYRVLTIDRSATKFPLGSYQFINLSPYAMRGMVGKTRIDSKSASVSNLRPSGTAGEMMNVIFEYHDGKQWRPMTKTRWAYRDDRRSLLCAYLDPRDKRVKMRSIPERLVPAKGP